MLVSMESNRSSRGNKNLMNEGNVWNQRTEQCVIPQGLQLQQQQQSPRVQQLNFPTKPPSQSVANSNEAFGGIAPEQLQAIEEHLMRSSGNSSTSNFVSTMAESINPSAPYMVLTKVPMPEGVLSEFNRSSNNETFSDGQQQTMPQQQQMLQTLIANASLLQQPQQNIMTQQHLQQGNYGTINFMMSSQQSIHVSNPSQTFSNLPSVAELGYQDTRLLQSNPEAQTMSSNKHSGLKLFLESSLEPVSREDTSLSFDDELAKLFGTGGGEADHFSMQNRRYSSLDSLVEPSSLPPPTSTSNQASQQNVSTSTSSSYENASRMSQFNPEVNQEDAFSLPSTMVPPTVLASVAASQTKRKRNIGDQNDQSTGQSKKTRMTEFESGQANKAQKISVPQDTLIKILNDRGYGRSQRIKSEDAGYDSMPSPLQLASFETAVVKAVHVGDTGQLTLLLNCGLSPNPCNQFRDSILDLVCKRSNVAIFNCLLEHKCDLRVADGFGRTPLHHCGWSSSFCEEIVIAILERDPLQLLIEDKRGQTPLEYVRPSLAQTWNIFLERYKDKFWPIGGVHMTLNPPKHERPDGFLPDPSNCLSPGLAKMVASGAISVQRLNDMDEKERKLYG